MKVSCAILSGGRSTRLGRDKATARLADKTLIAHVYRVARNVCPDVVIVSSIHQTFDGIPARVVPDAFPIVGPISGIASALLDASTPYVFVLACDLPFVTEESISFVISQARGEDIVVPKTRFGFEPLHAMYNRSCLSPMLSAIERGNVKPRSLFPLLCVKAVEADSIFLHSSQSVFTNINTEEDLANAERILGK
jgi:molybdopterin-guanine dinucleotide biosynthesis protein A